MALMDIYTPFDMIPKRGQGAWLYDDQDRRFLDFTSGVAVCCLGHSHPHLIEVLSKQANLLWHVSNFFPIPAQKNLAEKLVAHSFADRVFFCNSGLEAIEALVKLARRYHYVKGQKDRVRIITFEGAFHGRSLMGLSAAAKEDYLEGCGPRAEGFDHLPVDIDAVRAAITDHTAAVLVEPIQGDGGIKVFDKVFLQQVRQLCDKENLLLLLDEIQCGMGRTGKLWAYQHYGITPDAMALAKGLGGGFPIGAVLASDTVAQGMTKGIHGSTFGGNPLAVNVAMAVLEIILEDGFLAHVQEMSLLCLEKMTAMVKAYPDLFDHVRGMGLMLGLHCLIPNSDVVTALRRQAILTVPAGDNIVRFLPPLMIDQTHIDFMAEGLEKAANALEAERSSF